MPCCTTTLATRFTRATGDRDLFLDAPPLLRAVRLRPALLRPEEERLLDFLEDDLRPPLLRAEDFLPLLRLDDFLLAPDALRAPPELLLVERLRALLLRPPVFRPALLRPEDPDRELFRPRRELLDFLAAAIGKLRVGGFIVRIARFEHNKTA